MKSYRVALISGAMTAIGLLSCGRPVDSPPSTPKEAINPVNRPERIPGISLVESSFDSLPQQGRADGVWSGEWWPMDKGGTARRFNPNEPSPMEKYDAAVGRGTLATDWERQEAMIYGTVPWAGHCNGLAAAGIWTQEPQRSVVYNGVTFTRRDTKALLVEAYQGAGELIAGGRCNQDDAATDVFGRALATECRDANPATLHLALTNFLGLNSLPVIIDQNSGLEVWNYPVTWFQSQVQSVDASQAAHAVTGTYQYYPFNPKAKQFQLVYTQVYVVTGQSYSWEYVLELDGDDKVIGGEWVGLSKKQHPDFIWRVRQRPRPVNPYLDTNVIWAIYEQSIAPARPADSTEPPICELISSDPDGDGWGWENGRSCRVVPGVTAEYPLCSSEAVDPDGDGWGWENGASCRVPAGGTYMGYPICSSPALDPDGDGWGWENGASCIVVN
jgi:hypothetical protein